MKKLLLILTLLLPSVSYAEATPESIGSPNNGCILYPSKLPESGEGYKRPRFSRGNNFGNPELVNFLDDHAYRVNQMTGKELLIADLSKNNGGRVFMLHSSHQTGLDADIWYRLYDKKQNLSGNDIENLQPINMVSEDGKSINSMWGKENEEIVKIFAQNDKVERIFVNPTTLSFTATFRDISYRRLSKSYVICFDHSLQ